MMRFIFVTVIALTSFSCNQKDELKGNVIENKVVKPSTVSHSGFEGKWEWKKNNLEHDFSIDIREQKDTLYISYCCIAQQGAKMDCPMEDEYSFKVPKNVGNTFEADFISYFSSAVGEVRLTLKNTELLWQIVKEPEGEFYCPVKATMIKKE